MPEYNADMKVTGSLQFTRSTDNSISWKWTGGRRIEISREVVEVLIGEVPKRGAVISIHGIKLRLVNYSYRGLRASFVAMREGWLARIVSEYVGFAMRWAPTLLQVDEFIMYGQPLKPPDHVGVIPKLSLTGLLLRWC